MDFANFDLHFQYTWQTGTGSFARLIFWLAMVLGSMLWYSDAFDQTVCSEAESTVVHFC